MMTSLSYKGIMNSLPVKKLLHTCLGTWSPESLKKGGDSIELEYTKTSLYKGVAYEQTLSTLAKRE